MSVAAASFGPALHRFGRPVAYPDLHAQTEPNLMKEGINVKAALRATMAVILLPVAASAFAASIDQAKLDDLTRAVEPRVIEWRRDIHQHPELSNREVRTAKLV